MCLIGLDLTCFLAESLFVFQSFYSTPPPPALLGSTECLPGIWSEITAPWYIATTRATAIT